MCIRDRCCDQCSFFSTFIENQTSPKPFTVCFSKSSFFLLIINVKHIFTIFDLLKCWFFFLFFRYVTFFQAYSLYKFDSFWSSIFWWFLKMVKFEIYSEKIGQRLKKMISLAIVLNYKNLTIKKHTKILLEIITYIYFILVCIQKT